MRAWFVHNPKVALLASGILLLAGIFTASSVTTEVFPPFRPGFVTATVEYRGASVEEVHDGILLPLESAAAGLTGVRTTRSYARPSAATLQLELQERAEPEQIASELERAIAALDTLPAEADAPVVEIDRGDDPLLTFIISGSTTPSRLRDAAATLRTAVLAEIPGLRLELEADAVERLVDVPMSVLRAHNITVSDIGMALEAVEATGGIGMEEGDGSVRMEEVVAPARAQSLAELGSRTVSLGNTFTAPIASIGVLTERFSGPDSETTLDGVPAVMLHAHNDSGADPSSLSQQLRGLLERTQVPADIDITVWADTSGEFEGRLGIVLENGALGFLLVLVVLGLLVSPRVALWVAIGLPVVLLGSFAIWGTLGISLNQMTLFALMLVLGIVVDDSIVIGEAIDTTSSQEHAGQPAAVGVRQVWLPVVCAVITNMLAFLPLAFVPGELGTLFGQMAIVVLCVLALSLFEAGALLPAHLSHASIPIPAIAFAPSRAAKAVLDLISAHFLRPLFTICLGHPALMLTCSAGVVVLGIGQVINGTVPWRFTPLVESEQVELSYVLSTDTSMIDARRFRSDIETAAQRAADAVGADPSSVRVLVSIGGPSGDPEEESANVPGPHKLLASVDLGPSTQRTYSSQTFAEAWLAEAPVDETNRKPSANAYALGGSADEITFELSHPDPKVLSRAARTLVTSLRSAESVLTVSEADQSSSNRTVQLLPASSRLGVHTSDVTRELGAAFLGYTVDRFAGAGGEYDVRVRVAPTDLIGTSIELLPIRSPLRQEPVPFGLVATLATDAGPSQRVRRDGKPIVAVVATLDGSTPDADAMESDLPLLLQQEYPGLEVVLAGEAETEDRALAALAKNTALAGLAMYAILVIPLRSFVQPLLLLLVLPIGLAGGILCHAAMGFEFSMVSLLGTVALCGVLVNDGLLLIYTANRLHHDGHNRTDAALTAALSRFRPIMLTTITTAAGLAPLILETDEQAQFLVPMALTLGGGLLVASPVILLLLPGLWRPTHGNANSTAAHQDSPSS